MACEEGERQRSGNQIKKMKRGEKEMQTSGDVKSAERRCGEENVRR